MYLEFHFGDLMGLQANHSPPPVNRVDSLGPLPSFV